MYIQKLFRDDSLETLRGFIRTYSLATLVVGTPDLDAQPIPLELVGDGHGVIRGHIARANPLWRNTPDGSEALAIFSGPNAYISPRWYVNGRNSGRVAPSWNYATVHVRGSIRFVDDEVWIRDHLASLTRAQESRRPDPWHITDAPNEFVTALIHHLIGLEIVVRKIEGKSFLSQQRTVADRESITHHLRAEPNGVARELARSIEALGTGKLERP